MRIRPIPPSASPASTIFPASISFRCIPISTLVAAMRRDSLGHSSRRSPQSKTGNGFGGNGSDLIFCSSRKNATLDKFRNKRKVGCRLLHGVDCRARGWEDHTSEKGVSEREERRGCRGWPRRSTGKGWNRGRTINLTIYRYAADVTPNQKKKHENDEARHAVQISDNFG